MKKSITYSEWQEACEQLAASKCEVVPEGWQRFSEVVKEMNLSTRVVRQKLANLVASEMVETKKFKVMTSGGVAPIVHYRLKK